MASGCFSRRESSSSRSTRSRGSRKALWAAILNVQRLSEDHLCWPDLDVDLSLDPIREQVRYPLIAGSDASANYEVRNPGPKHRDEG